MSTMSLGTRDTCEGWLPWQLPKGLPTSGVHWALVTAAAVCSVRLEGAPRLVRYSLGCISERNSLCSPSGGTEAVGTGM